MTWPEFLLVLGAALLAAVAVPAAYVVWSRIVGLDPHLARGLADLPRHVTAPAGLVVGTGLGVGTALAPNVETGLAAVVLLASSTFAGLLAYELHADRVA